MSVGGRGNGPRGGPAEPVPERVRRRYAPPRVTWREPYLPTSFGISCAKQPGSGSCVPGPAHN